MPLEDTLPSFEVVRGGHDPVQVWNLDAKPDATLFVVNFDPVALEDILCRHGSYALITGISHGDLNQLANQSLLIPARSFNPQR